MKRSLLSVGLCLCVIAANVGMNSHAKAADDAGKKERKTLKVGDVAPAFELKGTDGKVYKLSDFKGKSAVVVAWYPKALTGG